MRQLIAILCLWPLLAGGIDPAQLAGWTETVAAPSGFLVDEDCEGVGTPSGWTDSGTVNWDETVIFNEGVVCDGSPAYTEYDLGQEYTELWVRFRLYIQTSDTSGRDFLILRNDSGDQLKLDHRNQDFFQSFHGATDFGATTTDCLPSATITYFWVHYVAESGGGGNGQMEVYADSTGTRGTAEDSGTTGTGDGVRYVRLLSEFSTSDNRFDDIVVSTTDPGDF